MAYSITMSKEKTATCGCWFGLVAIAGPALLFICYRIAHGVYGYRESGGHHYGGADFAVFDAFAKALFLGPLVGIALALLTMPPSEPRKYWVKRLTGVVLLVCLPLIVFAQDVHRYRERDIRIKNAYHGGTEKPHASTNSNSEKVHLELDSEGLGKPQPELKEHSQ